MSNSSTVWSGLPVFITGHTGFKGGWLALWLQRLGAVLHGYSLAPATQPNLFEVAGVRSRFAASTFADLADGAQLRACITAARPVVVFHLAAQPLVRESYADPLGTLRTNVIGTANLLEAVRACPSVRAVVVVTTDKVYENHEQLRPYEETDPLGGHDPYSASKAAAEIVTASYRDSFFSGAATAARIASARAGNVIGGGDWAKDRLVPDCLRAFAAGTPVQLRYPNSVRPWQHVLEPLAGYLRLAERLLESDGRRFATAWNFGPDPQDDATVGSVANATARLWGKSARVEFAVSEQNPHEAGLLTLNSARARADLGWRPRLGVQEALEYTVQWQLEWQRGADMAAVSMEQIARYEATQPT